MAKTMTKKATNTSASNKPKVKVDNNDFAKEILNDIVEESDVCEDIQENTRDTAVKTEKRKFSNDDKITCRSVTNGKYTFVGKVTKTPYRFLNYGDYAEIDFADLRMAANNTNSNSCCYSPKIIVEDDEFIEQFPRLKEFYESMYTTDDYREILRLPVSEMKEVINQMPNGSKECIKGIISTMIHDGSLDSVKKIQALDDIFNTEMLLMLANG